MSKTYLKSTIIPHSIRKEKEIDTFFRKQRIKSFVGNMRLAADSESDVYCVNGHLAEECNCKVFVPNL